MQALIGLIGSAVGSRLAQAAVGDAVGAAVAPFAAQVGSAIGPATSQFLANNAGRTLTGLIGGTIGSHVAGSLFKPPTDGGVGPSGQSKMAEASMSSGASWGVVPGPTPVAGPAPVPGPAPVSVYGYY